MEVQTEYVSGESEGETVITSTLTAPEETPVKKNFLSLLKSPLKLAYTKFSQFLTAQKRRPSRIRLRRKLLLLLFPFNIFLLVLIIKFYMLIPASQEAQTQFASHHPGDMAAPISQMRFLFTISGYIPDMAEGDQSVLENNLSAAEKHYSAALKDGGDGHCPVVLNAVIVKETLGEFDVRAGHFSDAMQKTNEAVQLLQTAPRACVEDANDTNKERHQYITTAKTRIQREFNQADQGTLFFSKVNGHYQFYYIGDKVTHDIKYTGQGNRCAHLSDKPKQTCIIKDKNMQRPAPDQPPPSSSQNNNHSPSMPPPPQPKPEQLPQNPKTSSAPAPKLDQTEPDQNKLTRHKDPKETIGDLLSNSDGRNHTNQ